MKKINTTMKLLAMIMITAGFLTSQLPADETESIYDACSDCPHENDQNEDPNDSIESAPIQSDDQIESTVIHAPEAVESELVNGQDGTVEAITVVDCSPAAVDEIDSCSMTIIPAITTECEASAAIDRPMEPASPAIPCEETPVTTQPCSYNACDEYTAPNPYQTYQAPVNYYVPPYASDLNYIPPSCFDSWCGLCEPCCEGCFFFGLGFLYARPTMDGIQFAQNFSTTLVTIGEGPSKSVGNGADLLDPGTEDADSGDDGWGPGGTFAIGFQPCCSCWSVFLEGTYLHSDSETTTELAPILSSSFLNYTTPLWNAPLMGHAASSSEGTWKVDFFTLDLLSYGYFMPWRCVHLMPNFGLRGAWIRQELKAEYDGVLFFLTDGSLAFPHTESIARFRYGAIGIKAGTDFQVPLFCCLSVIGGVGGSILYGEAKSHNVADGAHVEDVGEGPFLTAVVTEVDDEKWRVRANLESELGILFQPNWRCFCRPALSIGYFFSIWFDQSDVYNLFFSAPANINDSSSETFPEFERRVGNLQLQGLVVNLNLYF